MSADQKPPRLVESSHITQFFNVDDNIDRKAAAVAIAIALTTPQHTIQSNQVSLPSRFEPKDV